MTHGDLLLDQLNRLSKSKALLYEQIDAIEKYECEVIKALLEMGIEIKFPYKGLDGGVSV